MAPLFAAPRVDSWVNVNAHLITHSVNNTNRPNKTSITSTNAISIAYNRPSTA
jgi:hypothetical protein